MARVTLLATATAGATSRGTSSRASGAADGARPRDDVAPPGAAAYGSVAHFEP